MTVVNVGLLSQSDKRCSLGHVVGHDPARDGLRIVRHHRVGFLVQEHPPKDPLVPGASLSTSHAQGLKV